MKTVIDLLDNCHQFIYESENRLQEQHEIEKNNKCISTDNCYKIVNKI